MSFYIFYFIFCSHSLFGTRTGSAAAPGQPMNGQPGQGNVGGGNMGSGGGGAGGPPVGSGKR